MKMLLTAMALTIAMPAAVQADPGHAGHAAAAEKKKSAKAQAHPAGCHMMNGKSVMMKSGKMVPCSGKQAKGKASADRHPGYNESKQ